MNKPLVAAIGGVAFGITLCASIVHFRMHSRESHCKRREIRQLVVLPPPAPPPSSVPSPIVVDREVSACSPESALQQDPLMDTDQRLSMAQTEFVMTRYDCAMKLARAERARNPQRAYRIIGATGCATGNLAAVKEAYGHLPAAGRQYLIYVCQRQNISYYRGRFSAE